MMEWFSKSDCPGLLSIFERGKYTLVTASVSLLLSLFSFIHAAGTLAGTDITNRVEISYRMTGSSAEYNASSNTERFVVDRVADIRIDWRDSGPVEVGPGEPDRVLSFLLSNLGNGEDNVTLSYEHNATHSFSPPPSNVRLYVDSDHNGLFDSAVDSAVSAPLPLEADENLTLFLVADMPEHPDANRSYDGIKATSTFAADAGADRPETVDVVLRKGADKDTGVYRMRDYALKAVKSAEVLSIDGKVHTGTVIRYSIEVSIEGGAGSIEQVRMKDPIPPGTRYRPGTLSLDGTPLSDAADADAGRYDDSARMTVVDLGTLSQSAPGQLHRVIRFEVQVQ